ncbi:unnamed protein product [Larinioides sclopetarius]|uniref:Secreted protein n=1 Tax=Larinioides sclopetarius TaxID=280406 RepID=A0AAV2BCB6_9ARAC
MRTLIILLAMGLQQNFFHTVFPSNLPFRQNDRQTDSRCCLLEEYSTYIEVWLLKQLHGIQKLADRGLKRKYEI